MSLAELYDDFLEEGADGITQFKAYEALCIIGKNPTGLDFYEFRQNHGKEETDLFTLEELEQLDQSLDSGDTQAEKLEKAFAQFDDGDGFVSKEELQAMLETMDVYESGLHSDKEMFDFHWKTILKHGDKDGDGKISIKELVDQLTEGAVTM